MSAALSSPKILIVRTGAMGDVLHAMPAVAALCERMPEAEIGWVIEPRWEPLLRDSSGTMPLVSRVHVALTKQWSRHPVSVATLRSIGALRSELRACRYDVCVDVQGSLRSAVIGRMAGAKIFIGSDAPRERLARWFYSQRVVTKSAHVIEQAAEILSAVSGSALVPAATPLPDDAVAERWCRALLAEDARPVAMIAPGAGWGAKQWPAERYGAVAGALALRGMRVLVNALPASAEHGGDPLAAAVVTASDGRAEPVECSVAQLIALTRHVRLFIGGDTGPLHLAAALRVPVVALFGPTDPARTGPWGVSAEILRDASSTTDHRRYGETEAGLLRIGVEDVLRSAEALLKGRTKE